MENFIFAATDQLDFESLYDTTKFVQAYPDYKSVPLNGEAELKELLKLLGIENFHGRAVPNTFFSKYWDLSPYQFPKLSEQAFEDFQKQVKENNIDQEKLQFVNELATDWNSRKYRFVINAQVEL